MLGAISRYSSCSAVLALVGGSVLYGGAASAQGVLEEVVVVAQKREQSLQEVPISVAVVAGEVLDKFSINNATDLARSIPGFTVLPAPQGLASPKIRGLGTGSASESLDQSVGLFIDGVWSGRPRDLQLGMFDIARVEVIKGTQTSQLGKNTSLGAIQVFSRRPEAETGGYLQADYDMELESSLFTGVANLATAAGDFRLAVNYVDEAGYVDNTVTGDEGPDREQLSARLSALWTVGEYGQLFASFNFDDQEVVGDQFEISADPQGWYTGLTGNTDVRLNNKKANFHPQTDSGASEDEQDSYRGLVEFSYELAPALSLVSLTAYTEYDNERYFDQDLSEVDFLYNFQDSSYEQFSQEIRLQGLALDDALDYLVGAYYLDSSFERREDGFAGAPDYLPLADPIFAITGPAVGGNTFEQDVETWSLFAHGTYRLASDWFLTLGLRYTDETRDAVWQRFRNVDQSQIIIAIDLENDIFVPTGESFLQALSPPFPSTDLEREEDNVDGSVNLQYDFSETANAYVSWARGSKSGGFDTQATLPENAEFDTEEAETTELGVKAELLGGAARLNAAAFFTEIDDFQSVQFVGDGFLTQTIPVETMGVEFDAQWAASETLLLGFSATYADAENTDTRQAPAGSPEWTASFTVQHSLELGEHYQLLTNGVVNYRDDMYTQLGETYEAPAITLVDLRLALVPSRANWELAVMARNLFDEQDDNFGFEYPLFGLNYATGFGSYNRPRTVHLQARYSF